jgi:hypothetical protein
VKRAATGGARPGARLDGSPLISNEGVLHLPLDGQEHLVVITV